jgi:hypothetical protein
MNKELLSELQKAHQIIRNALGLMTPMQKAEWAKINERDGVIGEGTTRANERSAVIAKAAGSAPARKPYLPLPWHYENRGVDHHGRWGAIVSANGKSVAESVYEQDWYTISDSMNVITDVRPS